MRKVSGFLAFWLSCLLAPLAVEAQCFGSNCGSSVVAHADQTGLSANVSSASLYTVPASGAGTYRITCYTVVSRAATSSSTLPSCALSFTDKDTASSVSSVPIASSSAGNAVGATNNGVNSVAFNASASTVISYSTASYASTGATSMLYAVHVKLEFLGQ